MTTSPPSNLRAIQDHYASRLKARLARPSLDIKDARDGILDCFVASYFGGVAQGLRDVLDLQANPDEVARVTTSLFRRKLRDRGVTFENPTVDALSEVKEAVDRELHLHELPGELRGVHDQVCSLLLAKASGALPHAGDQSVVAAQRPAAPIAPPQPTRPVPPAGQQQPAATAATVKALRSATTIWLREMANVVERGGTVQDLRLGLERAQRLLEAIAAFE